MDLGKALRFKPQPLHTHAKSWRNFLDVLANGDIPAVMRSLLVVTDMQQHSSLLCGVMGRQYLYLRCET
jgi:hypothetical protein